MNLERIFRFVVDYWIQWSGEVKARTRSWSEVKNPEREAGERPIFELRAAADLLLSLPAVTSHSVYSNLNNSD